MKKTKLLALLFVGLLATTSCSGNQIKINPDKEAYTVGICQLVPHEALDAATKGFKDALTVYLGLKGRTVSFDFQNAANNTGLIPTIMNKFISNDVDLILANATPCLQVASNSTRTIPILGTSITEYGTALGIENFSGVVGGNICGTSDLAPLDQQVNIMTSLLPNAKTFGILYCASEANSVYQVNVVEKCLQEKSKTVKKYSFTNSNDLAQICTTACNECDCLYLPTDSTVASNAELINNIALPKKVPVFAGEEGQMKKCGFATLTISYEKLGAVTGAMAGKILTGEIDMTKTPIAYDEDVTKMYNVSICQELGITIPKDQGFVPYVGEK